MQKNRISAKHKGYFPAWPVFLAGFLAGTILPNLAWRLQWKQDTLAAFYLLGAFAGEETKGKEYLFEVVRRRGGSFFICALCGLSVFGVPLAVVGMAVWGMITGILLTMPVLEFGLWGGAVGLGLLFPHYFVYIPTMVFLTKLVYGQSLEIWKNKGLYPEKTTQYAAGICICALCCGAGIFLEAYCNPWIVEQLMKHLKIF